MHYISPANKDKLIKDWTDAKAICLDLRNGDLKAPLFSIIIPVLEEEKILKDQLGIFTNELRKIYNFEVIVSDGGSKDDTVQIAREYADLVILHNNQRRQTIAEGRNNGADYSNSDTLVFLNADTFPKDLENFLLLLKNFSLKSNNLKNFDALACYVSGLPDEVIFKDKIFYLLHNNYVRLLNIFGMGMGRGECQVVRKEVFYKAGKYNNDIVAGEDFDLYRRISKIGKIKFENQLHVYESPRRFRKYGYLKTIFYWTLNSLSVMFFGKSVSKEWEAVR